MQPGNRTHVLLIMRPSLNVSSSCNFPVCLCLVRTSTKVNHCKSHLALRINVLDSSLGCTFGLFLKTFRKKKKFIGGASLSDIYRFQIYKIKFLTFKNGYLVNVARCVIRRRQESLVLFFRNCSQYETKEPLQLVFDFVASLFDVKQ